jgi:hypothetical protein
MIDLLLSGANAHTAERVRDLFDECLITKPRPLPTTAHRDGHAILRPLLRAVVQILEHCNFGRVASQPPCY